MDICTDSIDTLYSEAINWVLDDGVSVVARGLKFDEVRFAHLMLTNPRNRIIENPLRKLSRKFMVAEFIWMMSGNDLVKDISPYNKNMAQFSDDGKILHGAYGPRLRKWQGLDQLENCLQRLKNDIYSRQAVMIILDPAIDFTVPTKDIPCNDLLQFIYREGQLDLCCYVRSNDLNWGFPYDVFHWTMLQELFANILKVNLGDYHHMVGSLHVYEKDHEALQKIANNPKSFKDTAMKPMSAVNDLKIIDLLKIAERELRKEKYDTFNTLPKWWQDVLMYLKG